MRLASWQILKVYVCVATMTLRCLTLIYHLKELGAKTVVYNWLFQKKTNRGKEGRESDDMEFPAVSEK